MKSNWWTQASFEQRYEQIKGGWELGMTQNQIAMNLGVDRTTIGRFARQYDLAFADIGKDESLRKLSTYLQSQTKTIDEKKEIDNLSIDFAFTLFENNDRKWELNY